MKIVIPSRGRANWNKQITVKQLIAARRKATLVVPRKEASEYEDVISEYENTIYDDQQDLISVARCPVNGIGLTRQWIARELYPDQKVAMFDDDLYFQHRPDMKSPRLHRATRWDIRNMLRKIEDLFSATTPMVGISARQGNNNYALATRYNTRAMNAYAFDLRILRKLKIEFGRMPLMEDFDITLRLLRAGYDNAVLYDYCWNQPASNAEGGCSLYRTARMQAEAAHKLRSYHPNFVKVITKETRLAWEGMRTRTDVRIAWQKASQEGKSK